MAVARSESQRNRDRTTVSDLYLRGWTQGEIAKELGISRQTVNTDIKAVMAEWKKERKRLADDIEGKYRYIYREAMDAWLLSLDDAETTIQEMIDAGEPVKLDKEGKPLPAAQRLKASTRKEGQSGNPALLAQAQAALKAIREMFGTDAATKQYNYNYDLSKATDEQLQRIAAGENPASVFGNPTQGAG